MVSLQNIKEKIKGFSVREWFLVILSCFLLVMCAQIYFSDRTKIIAIQEESQVYKNKADEEYRAKTILIQKNSELKKSNDSLYAEYKKIKDQDPLVITKTLTKTSVDTLTIETEVEKIVVVDNNRFENGYKFAWNYDKKFDKDNYFNIQGATYTDSLLTSAETKIDKLEIGSDLILDVVKSQADNAMRIVARSNNPYVSITSIDGAVINPTQNKTIKSYFKPKRWGLGVSVGYGVQYSPSHKEVNFGPQVGVGLSYNIFQW